MAKTTLRVDGMTCGACTSAVESGFKSVDGVGTVSVSLVMERAVVQHDPAKLTAEKVKELIEDRGFDAHILSTDLPVAGESDSVEELGEEIEVQGRQISITTLAVEGMTCGACTSAVEGGFKDISGIKTVNISLLSERAVIEHDARAITPDAIAEIIEDRGFEATLLETRIATAQPLTNRHRRKADKAKTELVSTTIAIEGMTCGACTSSVEGGFEDVVGVVQFNISLLAERAVIIHDPTKIPVNKIMEIIEDRGFDAKVLSSHSADSETSPTIVTVQLKIYGIRDQSGVDILESSIQKLPGVISVSMSLSTSRATVTHRPLLVGLRAIVEAVEALGFNALVAESEDNSAQLESLAKTREIQEWRRSFRYSLSFAIPVFFIGMFIPMFLPVIDFGKLIIIPGLYLGDVICLLLTIPVQFGIGKRFYISAYKSLKHGSPTMDVLVVLGTSAAFFFSVAAMFVSLLSPRHTRPSTVFDTSTMLITFITLGRYLENRAKGQTSKALSKLMSLAPSMATIYADPIAADKAAERWDIATVEKDSTTAQSAGNEAEEKSIPTELLELGDIVILRPGDKIPADAIVTRGQSYVDESMVTGEAMPIQKHRGSSVMAGTVNGAGRIDCRVTRAGKDTQLSQIVKLVQEAQTSRAPIQRIADTIAGYFVPCIIALGLLTFIGWMILSHVLPHPPEVFLKPESGGRLMVCMKLCISVIVFACPCALGLSTPTAVMVGTGVGATSGILVKGGAALETATKVTHVVFDKTGTLTRGKMSVSEAKLEVVWTANEWRRRLWFNLVGLAEMSSEHPIGKAIVHKAREEIGLGSEDMIDGSIGDFQATVGKGVSCYVEPATSAERKRYKVLVGNASFLHSEGVALPADLIPTELPLALNSLPKPGTTQIYTAIDSAYAGSLSLSDTLKPTARSTILALQQMNISASIVTGDTLPTALAIAHAIGIPESNVRAGVSPSQKRAIIKELQSTGKIIAMVGDGINDSPALATADIGIALSSGTDVAMEAADIVLMRPEDLLSVAAGLHLARTIFNRIKMNLGWACLYNIIGLPFAMGLGLIWPGGFMLHPMAAGAAMAASSVSVVASSLLLKLWKRPRWMAVEKLEGQESAHVPRRALNDNDDDDDLAIIELRKANVRGVSGILGRVRGWFDGKRVDQHAYMPLRDVASARSEAFPDV